jgi:hypothetical protein
MTSNAVLDKVRKLLKLAQANTNPHEAASAAARAQQLIDEHNLTHMLLQMDGTEPAEQEEDIFDFKQKDAPLYTGKKLDRWRVYLAMHISDANSCRIYIMPGRSIEIVGRPSDAETVRYLYAWLSHETVRLSEDHGAGCGVTWKNNFRLGVVDTLGRKLRESRREFVQAQRDAVSVSTTALVRVNTALAKIEERGKSVKTWMDTNMKLGGSWRTHNPKSDHGARSRGQEAGKSINLGGAKGAIGGGAKRLQGGE